MIDLTVERRCHIRCDDIGRLPRVHLQQRHGDGEVWGWMAPYPLFRLRLAHGDRGEQFRDRKDLAASPTD